MRAARVPARDRADGAHARARARLARELRRGARAARGERIAQGDDSYWTSCVSPQDGLRRRHNECVTVCRIVSDASVQSGGQGGRCRALRARRRGRGVRARRRRDALRPAHRRARRGARALRGRHVRSVPSSSVARASRWLFARSCRPLFSRRRRGSRARRARVRGPIVLCAAAVIAHPNCAAPRLLWSPPPSPCSAATVFRRRRSPVRRREVRVLFFFLSPAPVWNRDVVNHRAAGEKTVGVSSPGTRSSSCGCRRCCGSARRARSAARRSRLASSFRASWPASRSAACSSVRARAPATRPHTTSPRSNARGDAPHTHPAQTRGGLPRVTPPAACT